MVPFSEIRMELAVDGLGKWRENVGRFWMEK